MRSPLLIITALAMAMAAFLAGCTGSDAGADRRAAPGAAATPGAGPASDPAPSAGAAPGGGQGADERFVRPGWPRTSPSGEFVARAELGPAPDGVPTWIIVITDRDGRELFRDTVAYRSRSGTGITWLTGSDELWVLSAEAGLFYLQRDEDDGWSRERPRPDHYEQDVPAEIRQLDRR